MRNTITPEQLLSMLQALIRETPAFAENIPIGEAEIRWLGRVDALLASTGSVRPSIDFRIARSNIGTVLHSKHALLQPIYDALSGLELLVPPELQGAFIHAGNTWEGYAALVNIVQRESNSVFIVDPYVSSSVVVELVPLIVARQSIRILTANQPSLRLALFAASNKWNGNPSRTTPAVEIRIAPDQTLHDRLIIVDEKDAWIVTQSLKDIAKKSPASVTRTDAELAKMKAQAYSDLWRLSTPIS